MKKSQVVILGIIVTLCMAVASCTGTPVMFKSMMGQNYDATKGHTITAGACGFQLLLLIPININDRQQKAYEELMRQAGNDYYVTDIKVQERWTYAFVGTVYCTELEATAYPQITGSTITQKVVSTESVVRDLKDKSVEERLKQLDTLKEKGLVTQEEFNRKREEILRGL
jgi:hypothetical protein